MTKLQLSRETLRQLGSDEAQGVAGGLDGTKLCSGFCFTQYQYNCTAKSTEIACGLVSARCK
jgi:hypothetical protein